MQDVIPNQIFVTGYSRSRIRDERDLKDMFKEFGVITTVAFKGPYSFITYQRESEAEKAIKELHEKVVHGNKLKVEIVDNRRTKKTGPTAEDECFKCKRRGHWARDCTYQERSRSRSYKRSKRYSRSRSPRKTRRHRRRSYSPSSRSASYSSSYSRRRTRRRSPSRSRDDRRRPRRSSPPHKRHPRRRSSSSRKTKSRSLSKSRSGQKQKSKSNQSLQRD